MRARSQPPSSALLERLASAPESRRARLAAELGRPAWRVLSTSSTRRSRRSSRPARDLARGRPPRPRRRRAAAASGAVLQGSRARPPRCCAASTAIRPASIARCHPAGRRERDPLTWPALPSPAPCARSSVTRTSRRARAARAAGRAAGRRRFAVVDGEGGARRCARSWTGRRATRGRWRPPATPRMRWSSTSMPPRGAFGGRRAHTREALRLLEVLRRGAARRSRPRRCPISSIGAASARRAGPGGAAAVAARRRGGRRGVRCCGLVVRGQGLVVDALVRPIRAPAYPPGRARQNRAFHGGPACTRAATCARAGPRRGGAGAAATRAGPIPVERRRARGRPRAHRCAARPRRSADRRVGARRGTSLAPPRPATCRQCRRIAAIGSALRELSVDGQRGLADLPRRVRARGALRCRSPTGCG